MALKDAGYTVTDWDSWSRRDAARYHQNECFRKWDGFHGAATPVTAGTIVQLARDRGWTPAKSPIGVELDWDSVIGLKDEHVVIDKSWIENREVIEPEIWEPAKQLITYLEILFDSSDNVGYVTRSWLKDGKSLPDKGCWDRKAGRLIEELSKCNNDIGSVLGDYNPEVGAWIRFNPLDGKGIKNDNVIAFRYVLVESDNMDIDRQNAIIRELELPVACLVHSGGKSLHAIVRVDAAGYDEYRKRVDYLYGILKKNGLDVDTQNKNPSRLSRMPGVMRNGQKQFLVDTNIGKKSWAEWQEWIEGINDDLPEPESMADIWDNLPDLAPPLIDNLLRQGHKMLLAGPSKAGKSYALIELCCAIAEGRSWMGWSCAKGKVMYVNLELDRASCLHRFKDVYQALQWTPENLKNIDIWNLRGKSVPMDKLAPKLIRRAQKKNYIAIVIDPIYKVITGDENSADQMAHFCNQFDRVCSELGAAVIYCHHHSKGSQSAKRSMDRASGSGVFARDPDALIDLIELEISDDLLSQEENKAVCRGCEAWLKRHVKDWESQVSQDDLCSDRAALTVCKSLLPPDVYARLLIAVDEARAAAKRRTAWRIEGTLREFPRFEPINLWFDYPIHYVDEAGSLGDVDADEGGRNGGFKGKKGKKTTPADKRREALENAYNALLINGDVSVMDIVEYTGISENTIKKYIKEHTGFERENGKVVRIADGVKKQKTPF